MENPGTERAAQAATAPRIAFDVLVVDDEPAELLALETALGELTLERATSGPEVLGKLDHHDFGVILLAGRMSGMDGYETASRIRAREGSRNTPIIFLTTTEITEEERRRGYDLGAVGYMIKPFAPEVLRARISERVEMFRLNQQLRRQNELLLETEEEAAERTMELEEVLHQLENSTREIAARESNLATVIDANMDGLLILDGGGVITWANPAACEVYGRPKEDLVGQVLGLPSSIDEIMEIELLSAGGGTSSFKIRFAELTWDGKDAYLASLRDVTAEKREEELRARVERSDRFAVIGRLAGGVAHEINNPLAVLSTNLAHGLKSLDVLSQETPSPLPSPLTSVLSEAREMSAENIEAVERIRLIVKRLGSLSQTGTSEVKEIQVNDIVEEACDLVATECRHRARIVKDFGKIPALVADAAKLSQVLYNLLLNAADAIETGAASQNEIRISTALQGSTIHIAVEDTGSGIPENLLGKIFEPFFSTGNRQVGTGLGLSFCAESVRAHGGEIRVMSTVGKGSRFEVLLPLKNELRPPGQPSPVPQASVPAPEHPSTDLPRILVIDDEEPILSVFRRAFGKKGHIVTAEGGREGLAVLAEDASFDLIICDLMMPDVDGMMVFEALKESRPELLERVVYCSGGSYTARAEEFLSSVENTVLKKPFSLDTISELIGGLQTVAGESGRAGRIGK